MPSLFLSYTEAMILLLDDRIRLCLHSYDQWECTLGLN
jgi:hypothetical protein